MGKKERKWGRGESEGKKALANIGANEDFIIKTKESFVHTFYT